MAQPAKIEHGNAGSELLRSSLDGGVLTIEFNNPPAHALSLALIGALQDALDASASDKAVRVVVFTASGKVFSAGHDMKEIRAQSGDDDGGRAYLEKLFGGSSRLMKSIVRHPNPVIAAVDGIATAAGCQLVASCDLAIATDRATFCTPGVNIGGFCSTPMVPLSRNLSPKHAMEMLLTGEFIDAQTAREFGLVNRVVPPEYLAQVVKKYADIIASKSAASITLGKRAFYQQIDMALDDAYELSTKVMVEGFLDKDAVEGISAFFEKRSPSWNDGD